MEKNKRDRRRAGGKVVMEVGGLFAFRENNQPGLTVKGCQGGKKNGRAGSG